MATASRSDEKNHIKILNWFARSRVVLLFYQNTSEMFPLGENEYVQRNMELSSTIYWAKVRILKEILNIICDKSRI